MAWQFDYAIHTQHPSLFPTQWLERCFFKMKVVPYYSSTQHRTVPPHIPLNKIQVCSRASQNIHDLFPITHVSDTTPSSSSPAGSAADTLASLKLHICQACTCFRAFYTGYFYLLEMLFLPPKYPLGELLLLQVSNLIITSQWDISWLLY